MAERRNFLNADRPMALVVGALTNAHIQLTPEGGVATGVAHLMRPAAIANLLAQAGRGIRMYTPSIISRYFNVNDQQNPYMICAASAFVASSTFPREERMVHIAVQSCAVGFSLADCVQGAEAVAAMKSGMKQIWPRMSDELKGLLRVVPAGGGPAVDPDWAGEGPNVPNDEDTEIILRWYAQDERHINVTITSLAIAFLAYCKQGTASNNVLTKMTDAIRDDLGVHITLNPNDIRSFWNKVKGWFTGNNAGSFFRMWEAAVGDHCLRFRLIAQQASWTGMTNFINIKNALEKFPDFYWPEMSAIFPQDFVNYEEAVNAVGVDEYYGYRKDLGVVRSTLYPNLSYVGYCLMSDVAGERSLRDYRGVNRNVPHAGYIDRYVRQYVTDRATKEITVGEGELDRAIRFLSLRPGQELLEPGEERVQVQPPAAWRERRNEAEERAERERARNNPPVQPRPQNAQQVLPVPGYAYPQQYPQYYAPVDGDQQQAAQYYPNYYPNMYNQPQPPPGNQGQQGNRNGQNAPGDNRP